MAEVAAPIDAVLLDVGGVFTTPDHDLLAPVIKAGGGSATPEALDRGHYAGTVALDADGAIDWNRYGSAVARAANVPDDRVEEAAAGVVDVLRSGHVWRRILPGSVDGLRQLAATGVGLAIVSNSDGTVEEQLITGRVCQVGEGSGVPVAVVIDSAVVGVAKPDPGIFELALQALGVPAERAVHVGDTVFADVAGARAAGVRPLHLDPYRMCRQRQDHDHVGSLAEVALLVASSRRARAELAAELAAELGAERR
ncbi:MAG TPA: HAD-IIIA family hydrolase [Acidimicrobiales bacterium]|nr:HAD-IIIA family hydrolase [Acidimicrobiales bacterium]